MIKQYDLYLDESGNFKDEFNDSSLVPSLVGGLLFESDEEKAAHFSELFPFDSHAVDHYEEHKELFFSILKELREQDGHFLLFNNDERLKVVNGDITYLNVISDGLVQLLSNLRIKYPHDRIQLSILIAKRQAVNYKEYKFGDDAEGYDTIIEQDQYYARLEEKMVIKLGQKQITDVAWTIRFDSARTNKKLMIADLICNTYLTRNGKRRFTDEDRIFINSLYETDYLYSVFESATISYIRRLFIEEQYGEMIRQICELPSLGKITQWRDLLLQKIAVERSKERECWFSFMSLQISQYNNKRIFNEGIQFAENYKKYILSPFLLMDHTQMKERQWKDLTRQVNFWWFDTDFYILTMYDHLGNVSKCEEYVGLCRKRTGIINHSWEHIHYYFKYVLRELNCRLDYFDFDGVLERSEQLLTVFSNAKDLFKLIEAFDGDEDEIKSELLGSLQGIRLQAYTNIVRNRPEVFSDAVAASDAALMEFSDPSDLTRQYQYRCQLMVEVGKNEEALIYLLKSAGIDTVNPESLAEFLNIAYTNLALPNSFSLYHYSNIMRHLMMNSDPTGRKMLNVMQECASFINDVYGSEKKGHPWNLIVWNVSISMRCAGIMDKADTLYKRAIELATEDPNNLTDYAHAISMAAEYVLYCRQYEKIRQKKAESEYLRLEEIFHKKKLVPTMMTRFPRIDNNMSNDKLIELSNAFLK